MDQTCASCPSSLPNSSRCRRFIEFAVVWAPMCGRLVDKICGLFGEHGVVVAKDIDNLRRALVGANDDRALNDIVRALIRELQEELIELDAPIAGYDRKIRELYRNSEICQARLFGISKRGDRYLRTLLIHGARSAIQEACG